MVLWHRSIFGLAPLFVGGGDGGLKGRRPVTWRRDVSARTALVATDGHQRFLQLLAWVFAAPRAPNCFARGLPPPLTPQGMPTACWRRQLGIGSRVR
eukprot:12327363-Alexandrium_andersonii.AAC.1